MNLQADVRVGTVCVSRLVCALKDFPISDFAFISGRPFPAAAVKNDNYVVNGAPGHVALGLSWAAVLQQGEDKC